MAVCAGFAHATTGAAAQPVNDLCEGAITVFSPSSTSGTNLAATGINMSSCAGPADTNDVWYRFVAQSQGSYRFDTEGSTSLDTTLALFAACDGFDLICDDDGGTGPLSLVNYTMTAGQAVLIRVAGYGGSQGDFRLNVTGGTQPPPCPIVSGGQDVAACVGRSASFMISAVVTGAHTYRWRLNSIPMNLVTNPTAATPTLSIATVSVMDAGFYDCVVTNACGSVMSNRMELTICAADFNCSGMLSVQDIFDYVGSYFAGTFDADFNGSMSITVQDIFDFLDAYFAGCP